MQSDAMPIRQPVAVPLKKRPPRFRHFWQISFRNLWVRKTRTLITTFVSGIGIALVSQLAALYPTWRASKISVSEAIRTE